MSKVRERKEKLLKELGILVGEQIAREGKINRDSIKFRKLTKGLRNLDVPQEKIEKAIQTAKKEKEDKDGE